MSNKSASAGEARFIVVYSIGWIGTFVFLTFLDGYDYNGWNWLVAVPINGFLATIWPIYWAVLRWIM